MSSRILAFILAVSSFVNIQAQEYSTAALVIDHHCTAIEQIPVEFIDSVKQKLVVAYGHTSHGSQIITGMEELDHFMSNKGYKSGTFTFSKNGENNSLQLRDCPFSEAEDLGNPDRISWATSTRNYLNTHPEVNVVMWSWCGQVSWASDEEIDLYLSLMNQLETDYPNVRFVYMTGHLDGTGEEGQLNQNNQRIRDYCNSYNKILYDFADIESYDPDGRTNYMKLFANDNCDYTSTENESRNWAIDWQNAHTENVDWYNCSAAHSQALVGNLKAYAAWWLFARLSGWKNEQSIGVKHVRATPTNVKAYVSQNAIHFKINGNEKIVHALLYDQQGKTVFSSNKGLNNSISIDLLKIRGLILYCITSNTNKQYSGKVLLKNQ